MKLRVFKKFIPQFIWRKIEKNPELQKIVANMNWLFLDKVIQAVLGLVVGIWMARYLGPDQFGLLSFVIAFVSLFGIFARLGLNNIAIREIVKNPDKKDEILGTSFLMKALGGIFAIALSVGYIVFIKSEDIVLVMTVVISSTLLFQAFDIIDYWFQSQEKNKYSVYSRNFGLVLASIMKIIFIILGFSVFFFALANLIAVLGTSLALLWFYLHTKNSFKWKINFSLMKKMLSDSWPLILSGVAIAVYMKLDQVMIGTMLTNSDLGNYSIAVRLSEAWYFVPSIIIIAIFPSMIKARKRNYDAYIQKLQGLYGLMVWMGIIIAIPISIFSRQIINFLYGDQYSSAFVVLSIYVWAGIFVFLGNASAKYLVVENFTKIAFLKSLIGAIINIVLNLILIPRYGIEGAAVATLLSYMAVVLVLVFPKKTKVNGMLYLRAFNPYYVFQYFKNFFK